MPKSSKELKIFIPVQSFFAFEIKKAQRMNGKRKEIEKQYNK